MSESCAFGKTTRRSTKAVSFPVQPLPCPDNALLNWARTPTVYLPAHAIYAQANRHSSELCGSGSVSASFRSILLHSDQIKFQNEERLPAIRPLCCACLPLLSACRTGTHKHPVYVSKFIYLWFVLYYNILEQLKLYNGPCMLGLSFSLYP